MEKVGCITYTKNYDVKDRYLKQIIKDFISGSDVQEALNNNDFDSIFHYWGEKMDGYLPRSLIKILLAAGINFLPYMHKIPDEFFTNCEFIECVEIPASIKEIGWKPFQYTNLKKFKVKKRNSQLYIASNAFDNINDTWNQGNKTEYEFEGTKEEFDNLIDYNGFHSEDYITFTCSDGNAIL